MSLPYTIVLCMGCADRHRMYKFLAEVKRFRPVLVLATLCCSKYMLKVLRFAASTLRFAGGHK